MVRRPKYWNARRGIGDHGRQIRQLIGKNFGTITYIVISESIDSPNLAAVRIKGTRVRLVVEPVQRIMNRLDSRLIVSSPNCDRAGSAVESLIKTNDGRFHIKG